MTTRTAGLRAMLDFVRLVDAGGATPKTLPPWLGVGVATVYRIRRDLDALGVRIEWDEGRGEYVIADWGVLSAVKMRQNHP